MSCNVQIRNVSPEFHKRLKARAALEGLSMSDYIVREVGKALDRPMRSEVLERIRSRPTRRLADKPSDVIQRERNQGESNQGGRIQGDRRSE